MSRKRIIILGAAAAVFLCLCLAVFASLSPSTEDATAVADVAEAEVAAAEEPTEEPTATLEPTEEPTATEPPPTRTPAPTRTPVPTRTPAPTATPDAAAALAEYREWVSVRTGLYLIGLEEAHRRGEEVGQDNAKLFDREWREGMFSALGLMGSTNDAILEYEEEHTVPPEARNFHDAYLEMTRLMKLYVDTYIEGLEEWDSRKIVQATEYLDQATSLLAELPVEDIREP